ncbi:unnamed protein product [Cylicostephanus goldi]|uniref:Uncharacterized protein n=1 Tax=Cylicostephanus goldi TaxID=71465 RepID=A0A3P7R5W8_CYLGO|nr:unnamed protein product [Cylicostephanus goldi]
MEPIINIWDLDIINEVTPVVSLGSKGKGRRKKRDGREQGHADAVLSIAWNKLTPHVLASGGADRQIVLWDLDEAKAAQAIPERDGEVRFILMLVGNQRIFVADIKKFEYRPITRP